MYEDVQSPLNVALKREKELSAEIKIIEDKIHQKSEEVKQVELLLEELKDSLKNSEKEVNRLSVESNFF